MNGQTECARCTSTDELDHGIVVGLLSELNEPVCNICRSEELADETPLSKRESEVYALKELVGWQHGDIAEFLGLEKSTVDTVSQRVGEKTEKSKRLASIDGD
ncbi:hypothetical protein SAMN05216388_101766 [Halorientalis persicus]|uniref:HTH luxR-type domain-containing protein n=2 Tax=Halorientalis persicus TaxID=1367881 RepID=A0A1H8RY75_9EURY|nr:hypothetical protein SAMN05216388_101766 [Halorientalis persicus]